MHNIRKQSFLRTGFIAALIVGSVAGSVSTSFAAASNPGNNGNSGPSRSSPGGGGTSNPGGGGGGGGGSGAGMPDAVRVVKPNDCPPSVAGCGQRRPPPPVVHVETKFVDMQRCTSSWRLVQLEDGTVLEDHSRPMRKNCRIVRRFD